jgi:hypothetical protein
MEEIIVRYDGEDLTEHSMDLKLVAESLNGIETLVREVYEELGGKEEGLDLQIRGGFSEGSFEFLFTINQILLDNIELLKIIGLGIPATTGSLLGYLKWLKGRKIKKITLTEDGDCKIVTEDGDVKVTPSYMRPLLASTSVRSAFNKIISKPLRRSGIELFETQSTEAKKSDRASYVSVTKDEEKFYRQKNVTVIDINDKKRIEEKVITFLSVHKDKEAAWRIDFDSEPMTVRMEDEGFLSNVRRGSEPDIFANAYTVDIDEIENTITLEKSYAIVKVYPYD